MSDFHEEPVSPGSKIVPVFQCIINVSREDSKVSAQIYGETNSGNLNFVETKLILEGSRVNAEAVVKAIVDLARATTHACSACLPNSRQDT